MTRYLSNSFERIIKRLFQEMGYSALVPQSRPAINSNYDGIDLIVNGDEKFYIDVKFYRTKNIPSSTLKEMAHQLAFYIKDRYDGIGYLVINTVAPEKIKKQLADEFGVVLWDRETLYALMTQYSIELRDEFEQLLLEAQQGIQTYDVFYGLEAQRSLEVREPEVPYGNRHINVQKPQAPKGKSLSEKLKAIPCGKQGWSQYEKTCKEILEYLFHDDLALWEKQNRTDDGLSRFDLICRVASNDDYWKALVSSFNTRFILFEFKNYCDPITQDQVYATERYLFTKGLRSVGFIIAAKGVTPGAEQAAKGALKEAGKLIMFLTNDDLQKMLTLKDDLESCNDYLSNLLDNWLISLSR